MSRHMYNAASTVSEQIRQEIQRFESVHPCIYAIYEFIDLIPDPLIAQQIRENVVCIEDSFVNSQEWTLSRGVPDLKLGVLGSLSSGKSALVHRYLTGAYMQEESPEGGRFKKEVVLDGQPYMLLIRDEGGPPEQQFTHWVDAVILVFSLESESSFNAVYSAYAKMAHYRNTADIPMILVGTQDAISESKPRVIDDSRARKLANDLKRCAYYETCATYGLNVDRVFRDACAKIIQQRQMSYQQFSQVLPTSNQQQTLPPGSCPNTPSHQSTNGHQARFNFLNPSAAQQQPQQQQQQNCSTQSASGALHSHHHHTSSGGHSIYSGRQQGGSQTSEASNSGAPPLSNSNASNVAIVLPSASPIRKQTSSSASSNSPTFLAGVSPAISNHSVSSLQQGYYQSTPSNSANKEASDFKQSLFSGSTSTTSVRERNCGGIVNLTFNDSNTFTEGTPQLVTPSSTPTTQRKNRRISNIFNRKDDEKMRNGGGDSAVIGVGRAIPVKQGHLYKRSSKSLNKEWKKKYVCLCNDGRLVYYPSLRDYMEDAHGKEIFLGHTTVKVPGQRPKGSQQRAMTQPITTNGLVIKDAANMKLSADKDSASRVQLTAFEVIQEGRASTSAVENSAPFTTSDDSGLGNRFETPNMKKKEKKHFKKTGGLRNGENYDADSSYEFIIVAIDNRQWHFEASNAEDRDEWVSAIEQQIFNSLQGNESNKRGGGSRACTDRSIIQALRDIPGNALCADCSAHNPDWASLNLGALICIECCGIHRNLGSHISKVRSLDLDEWPSEYINVMQALGNNYVNSIWEYDTNGKQKPSYSSSREAKEAWIRSKYDKKDFLMPLPSSPSSGSQTTITAQLAEAMFRKDLRGVVLILAHCTTSQINGTVGPRDTRTPLHLAAASGSETVIQLLIWYNAMVNAVDHEGRSALWYAKNSGSQECMDILMRNGCTSDYTSGSSTSSRRLQHDISEQALNSTLNRRKTVGSTSAVTSRSSCGNAFDKLPSSVI